MVTFGLPNLGCIFFIQPKFYNHFLAVSWTQVRVYRKNRVVKGARSDLLFELHIPFSESKGIDNDSG